MRKNFQNFEMCLGKPILWVKLVVPFQPKPEPAGITLFHHQDTRQGRAFGWDR